MGYEPPAVPEAEMLRKGFLGPGNGYIRLLS